MQSLNTPNTRTAGRTLARSLLALAAGATLATVAQAETFYYTFTGVIQPGDGLDPGQLGTKFFDSRPDAWPGVYTAVDAGRSFSFTLGLDNGGNSSLGQTWTASQVKSMRFGIPTTSGQEWSLTFNFGGTDGLAPNRLNYTSGQFSTDASGNIASVFTALAFAESRSLQNFTPTAGQVVSNGTGVGRVYSFGLVDYAGPSWNNALNAASLKLGVIFADSPGMAFISPTSTPASVKSLISYATDSETYQYGYGTGLTDAMKWNPSTATGAPLVTAVPEPSTWALMGACLLVVGAVTRKSRAA